MWQNVCVSIELGENYLKSVLNNQLLINKEDALPAGVGMGQIKVQSAKQAPQKRESQKRGTTFYSWRFIVADLTDTFTERRVRIGRL